MSNPKEVFKLTCVYTGRRLFNDGSVVQRFEMPDGTERFFSGIKNVWIGYSYKIGEKTISTRPERISEIEIKNNPEWDAADALVDAKNAKKRAEAKMKAQTKPAMKAAVLALTPLCKNLDLFQREALIKFLVDQTRYKK